MKIRTIGAVAVLALALTSCGSDDDAASKAISESIMDSSDDTFNLDQSGPTASVTAWSRRSGPTSWWSTGSSPRTTRPPTPSTRSRCPRATRVPRLTSCRTAPTSRRSSPPRWVLTSRKEAATCIDENLTDEVLHDFLVAVFMNDQEGGTQNLMTALQECMQA